MITLTFRLWCLPFLCRMLVMVALWAPNFSLVCIKALLLEVRGSLCPPWMLAAGNWQTGLCSWHSVWVIRQVVWITVKIRDYDFEDLWLFMFLYASVKWISSWNLSLFPSKIQSEESVGLLLNTITLSVPLSGSLNPHFLSFSHGEYFYSLFQTSLNTELLCRVEHTVPLLLASANQNPSMVSHQTRLDYVS